MCIRDRSAPIPPCYIPLGLCLAQLPTASSGKPSGPTKQGHINSAATRPAASFCSLETYESKGLSSLLSLCPSTFYLEIILNLQESCQNKNSMTPNIPVSHIQLSIFCLAFSLSLQTHIHLLCGVCVQSYIIFSQSHLRVSCRHHS